MCKQIKVRQIKIAIDDFQEILKAVDIGAETIEQIITTIDDTKRANRRAQKD